MTIEQRLEQLELQNHRIERKNKRLTAALTLMAVAICAVVTVAATGDKIGRFDAVTARVIWVENDAGEIIVALGPNGDGNGLVQTYSAKGKNLVDLNATVADQGMVITYHPNGKTLVRIGTTANGGAIEVKNKTGEPIVSMVADEYGNGVVGAYNRKGRGPELRPGP